MSALPILLATIGASASLGAIAADLSTECDPVNRTVMRFARVGLPAAAAGLAVMIAG